MTPLERLAAGALIYPDWTPVPDEDERIFDLSSNDDQPWYVRYEPPTEETR